MPSPLAHAAVAYCLQRPQHRGEAIGWKAWLWLAFAASAPDLDFLPGILTGEPTRWHHGPSHSVFGAAVLALLLFWMSPKRIRLAAGLACLMHPLLDAWTGEPGAPKEFGVPLWWPLSGEHFMAELPWFGAFHLQEEGFLLQLLQAQAWIPWLREALFVGAVLLLTEGICRRGRDQGELLLLGAVVTLSLLRDWLWTHSLWGMPLGPDSAAWGLTAWDLRAGNAPWVPPLFPWLCQLAEEPRIAGLWIARGSALLLPAACAWAARPGGLWASGLAAAAALCLPESMVYSTQLQPEALLMFVLATVSGLWCRERWFLASLFAVLLVPLRDQGIGIALLLLLLTLWQDRDRRLWKAALLCLLILGLPKLLGGEWGLAQPWTERLGATLDTLHSEGRPPFLRQGEWEQLQEGGFGARVVLYMKRGLDHSYVAYLWILLALVSAARSPSRWQAGLLVLASPALVALLIWSDRRHAFAFLPPVWILWARSAPRGGSQALLGGMLLLLGLRELPELRSEEQSQAEALVGVKALGESLCAHSSQEELVLTLDQRPLLWCPRRQLALRSPESLADAWVLAPPASIAPPFHPVVKLRGAWIWRMSGGVAGAPGQEARYLLTQGPEAHPGFSRIPMAGKPPIDLLAP